MIIFRSLFLVFLTCPILPTSQSSFVGVEDDTEASSSDLGGSGLESLDLSRDDLPKGLTTTTESYLKNGIVSQDGEEAKFPGHLIIDPMPKYAHLDGPVFTVEKLKILMSQREVIAGAIAGAVVGVILALAVVAVMIYKWKVKDVGYTLGKKT